MSDGPQFLPPPPPTSAPPPPPPVPVIRWGIGDVFIGLLLWLAGGILASVIALAIWGNGALDSSDGIDSLGIGVVALSMVAGWPGFLGWPILATRFKGQRSLVRDFGLSIRLVDLGWGVLGGLIALALSIAAGIVWRLLTDEPEPTNADFIPSHPSGATALLVFLLVAVCTPIVEELFFRGLTMRAIGRRYGLPIGVAASSILFGLLHFQGSGLHGPFIAGVTALYGAVFALLVVRAGGRIGPSIIGHMVVNGVGVLGALYLT